MNDNVLKSPFPKTKICSKCCQKDPMAEYISKELKSNKPKQEKTAKIFNFVLEKLNKEEPKGSLKERANHAWILSMWSKTEIDLLEREIKTYHSSHGSIKK